MELANRLSRSMNYNYVGTEHILAGLLKEGTGVAAEVLTANGVELSKLLQMIEELISPGEAILVLDKDGFSPKTQAIVERAEEFADRFQSEKIGTEHLLLAIMTEGDCAASRLLNTLSVNIQKLYVDILSAMGEDPAKYREEFAKYIHAYCPVIIQIAAPMQTTTWVLNPAVLCLRSLSIPTAPPHTAQKKIRNKIDAIFSSLK